LTRRTSAGADPAADARDARGDVDVLVLGVMR
jgi:hypothetical protein